MAIATGLAYPIVSIVYLEEAIEFESERHTMPMNELPKLIQDLEITDIFVAFAWTAEFSVKISLLLFFKLLVKRLPRLTLYVKFVIGTTTLVWAVLVCDIFITCPHFGISILGKSHHPCVITAHVTDRHWLHSKMYSKQCSSHCWPHYSYGSLRHFDRSDEYVTNTLSADWFYLLSQFFRSL